MSTISDLCTIPTGVSPERKYSQLLENAGAISKLTESLPPVDPGDAEKLLGWITEVLKPTEVLLPPEVVLEGDDEEAPPAVLEPYKATCALALQILTRLSPPAISEALRVSLIAHTSPDDPWTTADTRQLSSHTLSLHPPTPQTLTTLLTTLKPLFPARHRNLTPSATAALRPSTARAPLLTDTPAHRTTHPATPTLLHWTVSRLPPTLLEPSWPLIIPPVLALLDDSHAPTRTRAAQILTALLAHPQAPPLLARTGLGPILWDAATPCLLSLPPLTPTALSVPLLRAGYDAVVALAGAMAPPGRERARLLGRALREGVAAGMRHAGEVAAVAEVLVGALGRLVAGMGVWCVRHLKECVPLLAGVLADPFAGGAPGLVVAAAGAVVDVVRCAWVRVGPYVWEVVRAVVVCWRRGVEDAWVGAGERGGEVRAALRGVVEVVRGVVVSAGEAGWEGVVEDVVGVEGTAAGLFEGLE